MVRSQMFTRLFSGYDLWDAPLSTPIPKFIKKFIKKQRHHHWVISLFRFSSTRSFDVFSQSILGRSDVKHCLL